MLQAFTMAISTITGGAPGAEPMRVEAPPVVLRIEGPPMDQSDSEGEEVAEVVREVKKKRPLPQARVPRPQPIPTMEEVKAAMEALFPVCNVEASPMFNQGAVQARRVGDPADAACGCLGSCEHAVCMNYRTRVVCGTGNCPHRARSERCANRIIWRGGVKIEHTGHPWLGFAIVAVEYIGPGPLFAYTGKLVTSARGAYCFGIRGSHLLIDAEDVGTVARWANHSCDPNAEAVPWGTYDGSACLVIEASTYIEPGSQITLDYEGQYMRTYFPNRCMCAELLCRDYGVGPFGVDQSLDQTVTWGALRSDVKTYAPVAEIWRRSAPLFREAMTAFFKCGFLPGLQGLVPPTVTGRMLAAEYLQMAKRVVAVMRGELEVVKARERVRSNGLDAIIEAATDQLQAVQYRLEERSGDITLVSERPVTVEDLEHLVLNVISGTEIAYLHGWIKPVRDLVAMIKADVAWAVGLGRDPRFKAIQVMVNSMIEEGYVEDAIPLIAEESGEPVSFSMECERCVRADEEEFAAALDARSLTPDDLIGIMHNLVACFWKVRYSEWPFITFSPDEWRFQKEKLAVVDAMVHPQYTKLRTLVERTTGLRAGLGVEAAAHVEGIIQLEEVFFRSVSGAVRECAGWRDNEDIADELAGRPSRITQYGVAFGSELEVPGHDQQDHV
jgi:hypothetical protein